MADGSDSVHSALSTGAASNGRLPADQPQIGVPGSVPVELAQLVTDHYAILFRYAYRLSGSVADAEDLTQQTFLTAQAKLDQLRELECARSWLFAILRNSFLRLQRKPRPALAATLKLDIDDLPEEVSDNPKIDQELLQIAINGLADEFRLVLMMFYFEGLSYRQIAEQLRLPLGTVMSRLSRAKGHLRARLFDTDSNESSSAAPHPDTARGLHA